MNEIQIKAELWKRGELSWKMHKGQGLIYQSLASLSPHIREVVLLISRRWGKSYLGVLFAIMHCLKHPKSQVFIVGPTIKQTLKIITPLIAEIGHDAPVGTIKKTKSEMKWAIGESTLFIGAFDTAIESFRGLRADLILLEESGQAETESYEYIIRSVLFPTLMHSRGRIIHLTTPALEIDHPLHTVTIPEAEANGAMYKYTIRDNPLLTEEIVEQEIKMLGGIDSAHTQRELFCNLVKDAEALIVPEFNDSHIVALERPKYTYFQTSIDFGGSRDKHAILLGYYDFLRNKVCYIDECLLEINTGTDEIIAKCLEVEARNGVTWLDPVIERGYNEPLPKRVIDAAGQTHVDIKRMDFKCSLPLKGKDSVLEGVNALRVAFRQGEIEIDPKCVHLIAALRYGRWDKHKKDFQRTKALGHCDMVASIIYNYRHINRTANPFPPHLGLHKHTHYFEPDTRDKDNDDALRSAFDL
jgi:hypothetical protein